MKTQIIHDGPQKTWALVLAADDEVVSTLTAFARQHGLGASHFTAIGAFSRVTLGYFDRERKQYRRIPVDEQVEVLSLVGDVALDAGEPKIHAHVVLGKADGTAHGGHLLEARVWPTLEVVLTESPHHLRRRMDPASGLALIEPTGETAAAVDDAQVGGEIGARLRTVGLDTGVRVTVANGEVTLHGRVATAAARAAAEHAARATRGIRGLRNEIEIAAPRPS